MHALFPFEITGFAYSSLVCSHFYGYFRVCTDFFNWNRVKVRYCDGASFSGDSQDEVSESMKKYDSIHFPPLMYILIETFSQLVAT